MDNHSGLNYDLFGNVIPEPAPKPAEPQKTPEQLDKEEDAFYTSPVKSHVPKYTAVKEGQQHPTGKHGQLKLFHEHVWPKGYSPERLEEVKDASPVVYGAVNDFTDTHYNTRPDTNPLLGLDRFRSDMRMTHEIHETLARSTVPASDLRKLRDNGVAIIYGKHRKSGYNRGAYSPFDSGIYISPESEFPPEEKLMRDIFGTRRTEESRTVMHELGHAHEHAKIGSLSFAEDRTTASYGKPEYITSPEREGYAEGFAKRHNRVTRAMKKRQSFQQGYQTKHWLEREGFIPRYAKDIFKNTRRDVYNNPRTLDDQE